MASHDAGNRSPARRSVSVLVPGDALVVAAFLIVGELSHGIDPVAQPLHVLETIAPFLVGWAVAAPLVGLYDDGALATPTRTVRLTTAAWLGAANVGLLLRGSPYFVGGTTWPFPLVITGIGLLFLVTWRVAAGRVLSGR
ncbi:DUF3054 domain-containing protein [Halostella litorea]|uniref:DUF3054 domain-containing protein n=1 Tax=Halostella litorea TaxID=2528831 RepID=UPI001092C4A2|nr:DUF3054 domain-containing protein [Halostella litorea]